MNRTLRFNHFILTVTPDPVNIPLKYHTVGKRPSALKGRCRNRGQLQWIPGLVALAYASRKASIALFKCCELSKNCDSYLTLRPEVPMLKHSRLDVVSSLSLSS